MLHKYQHLLNALQTLLVKYALYANLCVGIHSAILGDAFRLQLGKVAIIIHAKRVAGDVEPTRLKIAYDKSAEVGVDVQEAVVTLNQINDLAHIVAQGRLAARNGDRSQVALLVHLVE